MRECVALGQKKKRGFTFSEVVVVIIIIGVLASLAFPRFQIQMMKVKNQEAAQILTVLWQEQRDYFKQNGDYTNALGDLAVDIPAPKNFTAPVVVKNGNVNCGGGPQSYVARMASNDGAYTLYSIENGQIVCTPCPGTLCQQMGFPVF